MTRLDELDKTETRDLMRRLLPSLTDEQFEKAWAEFVAMKLARIEAMRLN